ncbi:MAG TPA: single-stranded DNA-binding protein [Ktedonobacteraceae bacterium]|nr:single-stranded DNA-binding protein [Ktedonobacteraceae bacterium]
MATLNQCSFIGRLGQDPRITFTPAGITVMKFSLAVDEHIGKEKNTLWLNIVAWGKLAENLFQYLDKGTQVYLQGRLIIRKFTDKAGIEHQGLEIIASSIQVLDQRKASIPPKTIQAEEAKDFQINPEKVKF